MKPDRLSGMAMMALHDDRAGNIDEDDVVDELALNLFWLKIAFKLMSLD